MADLIKSESNSVTYGKPAAGDECDNPDRCPHCNGYHLGGCHRAPAQATREQLEAKLESEEFYSLMQAYRFAPLANQSEVTRSFEAVKQFIRERLLGGK